MAEQHNQRKREIDADEVIRDYVESGDQATLPMQNDERADVEWYDQARQDSPTPADAVLTGGDIDAAWDQADVGDETVGGSSPTPDQDIVDEIGKALGVTYADGEPLHTTEKIADVTRYGGNSIQPPLRIMPSATGRPRRRRFL